MHFMNAPWRRYMPFQFSFFQFISKKYDLFCVIFCVTAYCLQTKRKCADKTEEKKIIERTLTHSTWILRSKPMNDRKGTTNKKKERKLNLRSRAQPNIAWFHRMTAKKQLIIVGPNTTKEKITKKKKNPKRFGQTPAIDSTMKNWTSLC